MLWTGESQESLGDKPEKDVCRGHEPDGVKLREVSSSEKNYCPLNFTSVKNSVDYDHFESKQHAARSFEKLA